jgi:hypothetical protein
MHSIKLPFLELFEHTEHFKAGNQQGLILLPLFEHKDFCRNNFPGISTLLLQW